ncbi:sensor histidine kinase [Streptomyces capparidis]
MCWTLVYLPYLGIAVHGLAFRHHPPGERALGWAGLAVFVAAYLTLVLSARPGVRCRPRQWVALGLVFALSAALTVLLGDAGLVLFVYVAVSCGALLPMRWAMAAVPLVTLTMAGTGLATDADREIVLVLSFPAALGGATMIGVQLMMQTVRELREAREAIAHLAASRERMRLARDLHDLLGQSLSLVTLKSELARRLLPERPEDAAKQVTDIERVSRQALVDVRAAVSGFRRPTLATEIAGARTALRTAQIEARIDPVLTEGRTGLGPEEESALAWALREAVTNVVRHSRARRCDITFGELREAQARLVYLEITDDGRGPRLDRAHPPGNGLTGLAERLILSGGRLETGPGEKGRGFRVRAVVPAWGERSTSNGEPHALER